MNALIERWGFTATFAAAAVVLFVGVGSSGLWEPWEMDRADLSRTLADPPQLAVALGDSDASRRIATALDVAARASGAVARSQSAQGAADVASRRVRRALDFARTRVVSAVVLDTSLLLPDLDRTESWEAAAGHVNEALRYVPNGRVLLVEPRDGVSADEIRTRIAVERLRELYRRVEPAYMLSRLPGAAGAEAAIQSRATAFGADGRLTVLVQPGAEALQVAVEAATDSHATIVRFKDGGDTVAVPPLETWLRTAAYKGFGTNELATRLPGVVLALIALWVMMLTVRSFWGTRAAVLSGIVLVTTPIFFGQARSAAGAPALMLALTLVACGLLLRMRGQTRRIAWAYLLSGLVVGFFASGLFALLLFFALALSVPLISGARELRLWKPALLIGATLGLAALWVLSEPSDGFAGQFRFTLPLFSDGPSDYERNFDLVIRQIGFGTFPWAPLIIVAIGAILFHAPEREDRGVLLIGLWFVLPVVFLMATQKQLNHLIWPAAPAAAIGVALLLDQLVRRGARSGYVALAIGAMCLLLVREAMKDPEPLVAFLTVDPPFTDKGNLRFPESLSLSGAVGLMALAVGLFATTYFGRLVSFARKTLIYFRRERPFAIGLGVFLVLPPIYWLSFVGSAHRSAIGAANAAGLPEVANAQKAFLAGFTGFGEPLMLLTVLTVILFAATIAFTYIMPGGGAVAGRLLSRLVALGPRRWLMVMALVWASVAVHLAFQVDYPHDFWGETLTSLPSLVGYLAAAAVALITLRVTRDRRSALFVAVAILALLLIVRLVRDAGFAVPIIKIEIIVALIVGWAAAAFALLPVLLSRPERFVPAAGAIVALLLLGLVVPLFDRYGWIEDALYPGTGGFLEARLLLKSRGTWICYAVIAILVVNRYWHADLAPLARKVRVLERGPVAVGAMCVAALLATVGTTFGLHPELAYNVSQKHLIEGFLDAEGDEQAADRIFKHGAFGTSGRKDANFYTQNVPEIRDRQTALKVLVGERDQIASLETPAGSQTRALLGFATENDADHDGRRDFPVLSSYVRAISGNTLTVDTQLVANSLIGQRLVGASGRSWPITANGADTISVEARARLPFTTDQPARAYFSVVPADAPEPAATAETRQRRALLLPAQQISELNHAFRKLSGGRHLPVLDGRSYRVLLATSWLAKGETQQNRLANVTYTQAAFDALTDPGIKRVSGTWDDTIEVVGYHIDKPMVSSGQTFTLTIYFKALKRINKSHKLFMHIDRVGGNGRIHGDHWPVNPTKHSEENKSCGGCFRTDHWLPGDIVADSYDYEVPPGHASGDHDIWVGFFTPGADKRVPVKGFEAATGVRHDGANRLSLGRMQVR